MTFEQVMPAYRKGARIRRKAWGDRMSMARDADDGTAIGPQDVLADDWEIVGVPFHQALNALLDGKSIGRHAWGRSPETRLDYRNGKLYKGLGTNAAGRYEFTAADSQARDWIIEA